MCGICGKISTHKIISTEELVQSTQTLSHRGPDDQGIFLSKNQKTGLGHRRLSLLDLSAQGHQPMTLDNLTIVFNGEIYNYIELKDELEQIGIAFNSQCDTEVILKAYQYWGEQMLSKLRGMFAFAILDEYKQELFLARDRFGIKPLFYAFQKGNFYFGSELKAIKSFSDFNALIEPSSISLFLANRFVSNHQTMWQDLHKLPAAHTLTIKLDTLKYQIKPYWNLPLTTLSVSAEEASVQFEKLLQDSLSEHLRSDVPVGAFLSGGLDSSATVTLMQTALDYQTQAFSIGFSGWNESEHQYAQLVANHVGAHLDTLILDKIDLDLMPTLMYHYDNPIADISILPTYLVSQLAHQKVKAVISGEGADELLGGYWWQKPENFHPGDSWINAWKSKLFPNATSDIKRHYIYAMSMGLFDSKECRKVLNGVYQSAVPRDVFSHLDSLFHPELSRLKQIQLMDIHRFMGELVLTKIDRASMAHSLEVRVPFLDHRLVEWLFQLPEPCYMQPNVQKPLLQKLLKGKVPEKILQRPKQGFVGPDVFYKDFHLYQSTLEHGRLIQDGIINPHYISKLLWSKDHWRLWKLFVLEHWWRVWVK